MSEVKVNKLSPRSGTTVTIGDSGDTINIVGTLQNNGAAIPGDISSVVAGTGLSGGGTSGDVTINIEAAQPTITSTGTLTGFTSTGIDDNADATAITINSSESVGIGETSPLAKLHVKIGDSGASANAGGNEMVVEDSAGAGISILSGNTSKGQIIFGDDGDDNAGRLVYDHSDNNLASWTNGSERMRIDSSGNVAIATTSAVAPLTVASGSDTGAISLGGDVSSSGITNNTRKIGRLVVPSYATAEEPVGIILADFNGTDNQIAIGGGSSSVNSATKILFLTGANATTASGTEAMRINSSGNVLIGASSAQRLDREKVEIKNTTGEGLLTLTNDISFAGRVHKSLQTSSGTHYIDYYLSAGNSNVGSITHNDSSTNFVTSSDYRLKENVVDMTNATDRLKQLQPKRFNFKVDADTTVDGFLAHEVSSVVPEAISGEKDAVDGDGNPKYQGIDQSKLVPLLVKTIQELEARITTLENN